MRLLLLLFPTLLIVCHTRLALDPALVPRTLGWSILTLGVAAISILHLRKQKIFENRVNKPLLFTILAYIFISGVSLLWTYNLAEGMFDFIRLPLFLTTFLGLSFVFQNSEKSQLQVAIGISIAACVANLVGMKEFIELMLRDDDRQWLVGLVTSILANKNLYSSFILFCLPFAYLLLKQDRIHLKILGLFNISTSIFLFFVLQSRAVILALVLAIFAIVGIRLLAGIQIKTISFKSRKWLIATAVLSILGAMAILVINPNLRSFTSVKVNTKVDSTVSDETHDVSLSKRLNMMNHTWEMIKDAPLSGTGIASWKINIAQYGYASPEGEQGLKFSQRPHNDFLWILSEIGSIGVLAYVLIFVLAGIFLFRLVRIGKHEKALVYGFGLITYLIIACFSFPKERVMHQVILSVFLAGMHAEYLRNFPTNSIHLNVPLLRPILLTILAFSTFAAVLCCSRLKGEFATKDMYLLYQKGNYRGMLKESSNAINFFYTIDPMSTPIKWYEGVAHFGLGEVQQAKKSFEEALVVNPYHIHVLNNLASCHQISGDSDLAIQYYTEALRLSPKFAQTLCNLSAVYFNLGRVDEAYETIYKCKIDALIPEMYDTYTTAILKKKVQNLVIQGQVDSVDAHQFLIDPQFLLETYKNRHHKGIDFIKELAAGK